MLEVTTDLKKFLSQEITPLIYTLTVLVPLVWNILIFFHSLPHLEHQTFSFRWSSKFNENNQKLSSISIRWILNSTNCCDHWRVKNFGVRWFRCKWYGNPCWKTSINKKCQYVNNNRFGSAEPSFLNWETWNNFKLVNLYRNWTCFLYSMTSSIVEWVIYFIQYHLIMSNYL